MNEHFQVWFDTSSVVGIFTSPAILYFAVGLLLVLLAKPVKGLTTRYHLSDELTKHDNKAVGVATAGYIFGVLTLIRGVLISGGNPASSLGRDLLSVALWTVISLSLLLASAWINRKFLLNQFEVHKELITDRNVGTGAVLAGTYIGTAFMISASISGTTGGGLGMEILDTLVYFVIGQLGFILLGAIYQRTCGYDIHGEIERDNEGAGLAFGATLIALAILISGQIRRDDSLVALAVWIPISLFVLLGSRWLVDLVVLPDARIHDEIARDRNWGVALIEGAAAIGVALLLDASFS
ncbi:DUF350 domain-containing protein [Luteolibacter yonseiensis]|uniref:DUF350 domain-containing protein n=1 Tax=Luteolibacter yonseiensis TaxID=1144680 RepID=A0A934R9V0_9BACT|nr:DUF350 domain-containing protein [Luteolibacter yonseiensis]MBK1817684.1 DUF350 domain-containing protein [Luteolibacter yonseiensis]